MPQRRAAARPGFLATAATSAVLVALPLALTAALTRGFEAWTYEELRRRDAVAGALQAPAMPLRDSEGRIHTAFDGSGTAVTLLNFVYTRCTSICQAQGSEYTRMQQALRAAGSTRVHLLSVSIAPADDDRAALAAHAKRHQADPARWTVAAPLDEQQGRAALRALGVVAVADGLGGYVHNGSLHVVDGGGRVHRIFDDAAWPQALAAAQALAGEAAP